MLNKEEAKSLFEIRDDFYLNGEKIKIISGSVHYFRIVAEYWRDRLEKLKNMGCNTVETYIPWNFHEPYKGQFRWDGMHDVVRFIKTAEELGLYMIIRPSPYICAEWEFGGLPAWLLKDKGMKLRCSYKPYLDAVQDYYDVLMPMLAPLQIDNGGNIIMMQIENEYGYYGNDTAYLEFLRDRMRKNGITVPFVTSDGPWKESVFRSGQVDGALPTGNFGSSAEWQFGQMRKYMGDGKPLMCMEFWNGWFDAWGEEHHTTPPETAAKELEELLKQGHVNFYMFEGGTSFGFMSGRNNGKKTADVTSYDYDAPLTEDGQITPKYELFKNIISKYRSREDIPLSTQIRRGIQGKRYCTGKAMLFDVLEKISTPVTSPYPLTMEELDSYYGYVVYRAVMGAEETLSELRFDGMCDRAQVFSDRKLLVTVFDENVNNTFEFDGCKKGAVLDILYENMGRENFGTGLENQRKGLTAPISINDRRHYGYEIFPLPLDEEQLDRIEFSSPASLQSQGDNEPAFYLFEFNAVDRFDTFLDLDGFGKGVAFINGFNLGRFWEIGPQKRLYIPAHLFKKGKNTIIIFETEGKAAEAVNMDWKPMLSPEKET